ncbi:efflux RND transporter permease subunit [Alkalisalibacterium limincola]|uniref:Efflux RND transporter permease subunit n=1 Tax=Alkalisalibacterium limincola TaxID=2699169 RepID=A0A5C8KYV2_9GAMM|nr:efflux RND transporter permease subunit [Alkalisalibacterium limincola]
MPSRARVPTWARRRTPRSRMPAWPTRPGPTTGKRPGHEPDRIFHAPSRHHRDGDVHPGAVRLHRAGRPAHEPAADLSYPTLTVRTEYTGAAPSEIENLLTEPVEEAVGVVKGLRRLRSVSRTGQSDVLLEFAWGTNMDIASIEVRDKLEVLRLPLEAEKPVILRFDPSTEPVMRMVLAGARALRPSGRRPRRPSSSSCAGMPTRRSSAALNRPRVSPRSRSPVAWRTRCRCGWTSSSWHGSTWTRGGSSSGCDRRTSTSPAAGSRRAASATWCAR